MATPDHRQRTAQNVAALTAARLNGDRMGMAALVPLVPDLEAMSLGMTVVAEHLAGELAELRGCTMADVFASVAVEAAAAIGARSAHPSQGPGDVVD